VDVWRSSKRAIAGAAALAVAASVPFVVIYGSAIRDTTAYSYEGVLTMVPAARSFLDLGRRNLLWGWLSVALEGTPPFPGAHELRVGVGVVLTLAWIVTTVLALRAAAGGLHARPQHDRDAPPGAHGQADSMFLAAMVLASWAFLVLGLKYGEAASPWRFVHAWVPGAGAVRAVARYVLLLTLPLSIGCAWLIDMGLRWAAQRRRPIVARGAYALIVVLASFGLSEQIGSSGGFSKRAELAYLEALAADLPADCEVFYLAPPRPGTPAYEHQYDAMLVSAISGVPTINGLTSQLPRGWNLMATDPSVYEANARQWIARQHVIEKVCRLEIATPIEIFRREHRARPTW
jgi:hypothetical protein